MILAKAPRRRRLSAEARRILPWCVALSASVHVLLLVLLVSAQPQPRSGGWAPHSRWRPAGPIGVHLAAQATVPPLSTAVTEPSFASLPPTPASAASAATGTASTASSALPPDNAPSASNAATAAAPVSPASLAASEAGEAFEGGYVPRPLLSIAPQPEIPVVIPAPSSSPGTGRLIGRYSGVLALYIDEQGRVRRIEAEPPALPESMERAARAAFLSARFSPGQMDGRAVKSRIRVEVVFDDELAQAASAASTAQSASSASSVARAASNQASP
jgi:protein TonB